MICIVKHLYVSDTSHLSSYRLVKQVIRPTKHMQLMLSIVVSQSQSSTRPASSVTSVTLTFDIQVQWLEDNCEVNTDNTSGGQMLPPDWEEPHPLD